MSQEAAYTTCAPRRRWPVILLLWLVMAGIGIAAVWKSVKITYTATAQVEVKPIIPRILYADEQSEMMPAFEGFLNTQAQIMTSEGVLRHALRDRAISELTSDLAEDPVLGLRHGLQAAVIPHSYVLELRVTRDDPETAKVLAKAILTSYLVRAGDAEMEMRKARLEKLLRIKQELESTRNSLQKTIRGLAQQFQVSSPTMLETFRKSMTEGSLQIQQEWSKAALEIEQLEMQLTQLRQVAATKPGESPAAFPDILPDEDSADRVAAIDRDPMVQALRKAIDATVLNLAQLASAEAADAKETSRARNALAELKRNLDKELERAAKEHEKARLEMAFRMKDVAVATLERKLARATTLRDQLNRTIQETSHAERRLGQVDQEICRVRLELDDVEKRYQGVAQEINKLEVEKDRPSRVSVISEAEVREDGIKDRRPRLSVAIALGTLIVAVGLGFLTRRRRFPVIPSGLDPRGTAQPTQ